MIQKKISGILKYHGLEIRDGHFLISMTVQYSRNNSDQWYIEDTIINLNQLKNLFRVACSIRLTELECKPVRVLIEHEEGDNKYYAYKPIALYHMSADSIRYEFNDCQLGRSIRSES